MPDWDNKTYFILIMVGQSILLVFFIKIIQVINQLIAAFNKRVHNEDDGANWWKKGTDEDN